MLALRKLLPTLLIFIAIDVFAVDTNIGYLYPAGAKIGTTVKVTVGGQSLNKPQKIHVSGEGVTAKIIQYGRLPANFNADVRKLLEKTFKELKEKKLAETSGQIDHESISEIRAARRKAAEEKKKPAASKKKTNKEATPVKMPKIPILFDLESKSIAELEHIKNILFTPRRMKQINRQLSELILIELTIDPDAKPGNRQLRLETKNGLSNPVVFQIGTLPETNELEPNGDVLRMDSSSLRKTAARPKPNTITPPVTVNGQIYPGDIDKFVFSAKKGQKLVIETHARSLIPYLADAVPGWFQATIALFDEKGIELAFTDDYGFNPDPVMFYDVPEDGQYQLHIKDAIYRGREDFVYRISIGQTPFITSVFPLGAKQGSDTTATIAGRNLPQKTLNLDTRSSGKTIRTTALYEGKLFSNSIPYAVDTLPETAENDSNNTFQTAQTITMPTIVNGLIDKSGDTDIFSFNAKANDTIVAEVLARRLNSRLDSILKLTDKKGNVITFNDDHVLKDSHLHKDIVGSMTHHADSYLTAKLPKDGTYCIQIEDANRQGGKSFAYRLRISKPHPSFDLRTSTSSIYTKPGGITPITIHAMRKDGFDGPIKIEPKDISSGFTIQASTIPAGENHIRMTVTAPKKGSKEPLDLQLIGKANANGKSITQPVIPADDVMQAFLYRHLLESQDLMVAFKQQKWPNSPIKLIAAPPLKINTSKPISVHMKTPRKLKPGQPKLKLNAPPEGLTISDIQIVKEGFKFKLTASPKLLARGFSGNIIVESFGEYTPKQKKGKPKQKPRTYSAGFLPAIPVQIAKKIIADKIYLK